MTPAERIARLKELAAKATPGEWKAVADPGEWRICVNGRNGLDNYIAGAPIGNSRCRHNAAFIAACRTDVPWLIEQLERTQALLDKANEHVEELAKKLHATEIREREAFAAGAKAMREQAAAICDAYADDQDKTVKANVARAIRRAADPIPESETT